MSVHEILQARIDILQSQIDHAVETGATHNLMGMPMADQIKSWKKLIRKAKKQMVDE